MPSLFFFEAEIQPHVCSLGAEMRLLLNLLSYPRTFSLWFLKSALGLKELLQGELEGRLLGRLLVHWSFAYSETESTHPSPDRPILKTTSLSFARVTPDWSPYSDPGRRASDPSEGLILIHIHFLFPYFWSSRGLSLFLNRIPLNGLIFCKNRCRKRSCYGSIQLQKDLAGTEGE